MTRARRWPYVVAFLLALPIAGLCFAYWTVSHPANEPRALPPELVSLASPEGATFLARSSARADLAPLERAFQTQEKSSWCGVASSAIVLSALQHRYVAQASVFDGPASEVRSQLRVTFGGMTLDDLGGILRGHGRRVTVVHAGDASVDAFRAVVRANLATPGDYLVVNYARAALGQGDTGHVSPLAAYDETSDRVLVLEPARYRWPATWVPLAAMFRAMNTVDPDRGRTRGWVVVR